MNPTLARPGWVAYLLQGLLLAGLILLLLFASSTTRRLAQTEQRLQQNASREPQLADPASVYVEVVQAPSPLSQLSAGFLGIAPSMHLIRVLGTRPLSNIDQIEHPSRRRYGRIDLSFVFLVALPVAILPILFFLYRQCLASGAVGALLEGKVSLFDFSAERIMLPLGVFLGVILLSTLAAVYTNGLRIASNEMLGRTSLWIVLVGLYLLAWFLLFALLLVRGKDFAGAALRYSAVFLGVVIVLPFFLQSVESAVARPHSRLEISISRRQLSATTTLADHAAVDRFLRAKGANGVDWASPLTRAQEASLVSLLVEEQLKPRLEAFEGSVRLLDRLNAIGSWFSPYLVAQFGVDDLAGTGLARYSSFRDESLAYFERWQGYFLPFLAKKQTLDFDGLRAAPKFQLPLEDPLIYYGLSAARIAYLALIVVGLIVLLRRELALVLPKRRNAAR